MNQEIPSIFSAFQCCVCGGDNKRWFSTNRAPHPFDSPGNLTCMDCGVRFPVEHGYLNLQVGPEEPVVPFQKLMQMKAPVAVYEGVWRPLGYFIASKHSFARSSAIRKCCNAPFRDHILRNEPELYRSSLGLLIRSFISTSTTTLLFQRIVYRSY